MSRGDISWMRASSGVSCHWTSRSVMQDGRSLPYEEAVDRFDAGQFADTLQSVGARHCIFTLTHAEEYLAMPNRALESLLPGRTTRRDLIGEIIAALQKRGIRFIAYFNHSCNGNDDPAWMKACGYSAGDRGHWDRFARNICDIVAEISGRYGRALSGWWFDSSYSVDPRGPHNSISGEIGSWRFPWEKLDAAARSGNPDSAVTFNAGVGLRFLYADCQDYYAGETVCLDEVFTPEALPGMQDHRWICADSPEWVFSRKAAVRGFAPPRFTDEELRKFITEHLSAGRMVTLNLEIDQSGILNPAAAAQLKRLLNAAK